MGPVTMSSRAFAARIAGGARLQPIGGAVTRMAAPNRRFDRAAARGIRSRRKAAVPAAVTSGSGRCVCVAWNGPVTSIGTSETSNFRVTPVSNDLMKRALARAV